MRALLNIFIALLLVSWLSSCANKEKIYKGMYDGFNLFNIMNDTEMAIPSEKEHPTYQQYKEERQNILRNNGEGK